MDYYENRIRTMVIGAGSAARTLIDEIFKAKISPYTDDKLAAEFEPVCIIDNDPEKLGTEIHGIKVVGTTDEIPEIAEKMGIKQIILAIPSLNESDRNHIVSICHKTKLPLKIIPFIGSLILGKKTTILEQVRNINIDDLLGRSPVKFDNEDIRSFITGKCCLVTGGGGSIGSEIVRQIARYNPEKIIIIDIYENNAYEIEQELKMEYGDSLNLEVLIASVRDYFRISQIFEEYRPQIVFHAAAHKHVPLMEKSPAEAVKNNVVGTFYVASIAQYFGVEKFVMISTDKAVNPTNVMGATKRCCEMIVQYFAQLKDNKTEFVTTRFGNVLGSNGSVIPLFQKQIERGGPVTVTHPNITRYFMTIPEAVSLVMEAAVMAKGGEIFILDMGKPVKIVTLAENLIYMYNKKPYTDIEIEFTGLRPGEKIKEELLIEEEGKKKTSNKLIFIGQQIEIDGSTFIDKIHSLKNLAMQNDHEAVIKALHDIVPTYVSADVYNRENKPDKD